MSEEMSIVVQLQEMEMKGASGGPEYERKLLEVVHSVDGKQSDSRLQDGDLSTKAGDLGHPTDASPSPVSSSEPFFGITGKHRWYATKRFSMGLLDHLK